MKKIDNRYNKENKKKVENARKIVNTYTTNDLTFTNDLTKENIIINYKSVYKTVPLNSFARKIDKNFDDEIKKFIEFNIETLKIEYINKYKTIIQFVLEKAEYFARFASINVYPLLEDKSILVLNTDAQDVQIKYNILDDVNFFTEDDYSNKLEELFIELYTTYALNDLNALENVNKNNFNLIVQNSNNNEIDLLLQNNELSFDLTETFDKNNYNSIPEFIDDVKLKYNYFLNIIETFNDFNKQKLTDFCKNQFKDLFNLDTIIAINLIQTKNERLDDILNLNFTFKIANNLIKHQLILTEYDNFDEITALDDLDAFISNLPLVDLSAVLEEYNKQLKQSKFQEITSKNQILYLVRYKDDFKFYKYAFTKSNFKTEIVKYFDIIREFDINLDLITTTDFKNICQKAVKKEYKKDFNLKISKFDFEFALKENALYFVPNFEIVADFKGKSKKEIEYTYTTLAELIKKYELNKDNIFQKVADFDLDLFTDEFNKVIDCIVIENSTFLDTIHKKIANLYN